MRLGGERFSWGSANLQDAGEVRKRTSDPGVATGLAYTAAGVFDGFFEMHLAPWDVAAGSLMIQEAGGIITGFDGAPLRLERPQFIASATESLHRELRSMVA